MHNTLAEASHVMKKLPRRFFESVSPYIYLLFFLFGLSTAKKSHAVPPRRPPHGGQVARKKAVPISYQHVGPMVYPATFPEEKTPRFHPNPAGDVLHIEMPQAKKSMQLHVYGADGTLRASCPLSEGDNLHTCGVALLAEGIYYAHILNGAGHPLHTFPFIKK